MKRLVIDVKRDNGAEPTASDLEGVLDMISRGIEPATTGGYGRVGPGPSCGYRWTMVEVPEDGEAEGGI